MQNLNIPKFVEYYSSRDINGDGWVTLEDRATAADIARRICVECSDRFVFEGDEILSTLPALKEGQKGWEYVRKLLPRDLNALIKFARSVEALGTRVSVADIITKKLDAAFVSEADVQSAVSHMNALIDGVLNAQGVVSHSGLWRQVKQAYQKAETDGFSSLSRQQKQFALSLGAMLVHRLFKAPGDGERVFLSAIQTLQSTVGLFEYYSEDIFNETMKQSHTFIREHRPKIVALAEHHDLAESWLAVFALAEEHSERLPVVALEMDHEAQPWLDAMFELLQSEQGSESEKALTLDLYFEHLAKYIGIAGYSARNDRPSPRVFVKRMVLAELMRRGVRFFAIDAPSNDETDLQLGQARDKEMAKRLRALTQELDDDAWLVYIAGLAHVAPGLGGTIDLLKKAGSSAATVNLAYTDGLPHLEAMGDFDVDMMRLQRGFEDA